MVELLYIANYLIFALFLSLFAIEIGIAIASLIDYDEYKEKLKGYLMPMWEINGTFAVFYLVNLEATYPKLLPVIGTAFIVPALLAIMLVVGRNIFIVASEFESKLTSEENYSKIYSAFTIIATYLLVCILGSALTGIGLNIPSSSINLVQVLANPFSIVLFIGLALLSFAAVGVVFSLKKKALTVLALLFSVALLVASLWYYDGYVFQSALSQPIYLAIIALLLVYALAATFFKQQILRLVVIPAVVLIVLIFGLLQYPNMAGGALNMPSVYTSPVFAPYISIGTIVGCALLLIVFAVILKLMRE